MNFYKGSIKEEIISLQNNENMIIFSIDTNTYVTKKIQKSYFKYTKYKNTNNIDENNTKKSVSKSKERKLKNQYLNLKKLKNQYLNLKKLKNQYLNLKKLKVSKSSI